MDCTEVRDKLLDAVEGDLPGEQERDLLLHLTRCVDCREEYDTVRKGAAALRDNMRELAPHARHLTSARRDALMAQVPAPKVTRLMTVRRFVAAAGVAAIIASAIFLVGDLRQMLAPAEAPAEAPAGATQLASRDTPAPQGVPVVLTAASQDEPVRVMPRAAAGRRPVPESSAALVHADSPGVAVPVDHKFYDPQESSRWW